MSFFKNLFKGNKEQEVKKEQIVPLTNGELVNISQVPDEVFSSKMMGITSRRDDSNSIPN